MPEEIGERFERRAQERVETFGAGQSLGERLELAHRFCLGRDGGDAVRTHGPAIDHLVDVHAAQLEHPAHPGL